MGDGYRAIRMVNNIRLNVDAFHGDKKSGGVHDGTTIVLWEWNKGDNQLWRIVPYCKFLYTKSREIHVFMSSTCLILFRCANLTSTCIFFHLFEVKHGLFFIAYNRNQK